MASTALTKRNPLPYLQAGSDGMLSFAGAPHRMAADRVSGLEAAKKKTPQPDSRRDLQSVNDISPSLAAMLRPQAAYRWLLPYVASITPTYIESTLRGALAGNHVQAWELFDLMWDSDPEIQACIGEYVDGVCAKKVQFIPYALGDDEPSDMAMEKMHLTQAAFDAMRPDPALDECDLKGTIRDILAARFHNQSIMEIDWASEPGGQDPNFRKLPGIDDQVLVPRATYWVHPVCYAWDMNGRLGLRMATTDMPASLQRNPFRPPVAGQPGSMSTPPSWNWIQSQPMPNRIQPFPKDKFLIGIQKAKTGTPLSASVLRCLAWWWCASNFCGDWLLNYAQLFGIPFRKAKMGPGSTTQDWAEVRQMLQSCGSTGYMLMKDVNDVEFMETSGGGGQSPQAFLFHFADSQKRKAILRQTMTGGQHGAAVKGVTGAFGEVESDTKQQCINAGADYAAGVINLQFIPTLLNRNYGKDGDLEAPRCVLVDDKVGGPEDAQVMEIVSTLIDVPDSHIRRIFRIPKVGTGDGIAGVDGGTLGATAKQAQEQAKATAQALAQAGQQQPGQPGQPGQRQLPNAEDENGDPIESRRLEAAEAGHPFYGNQWTEHEGASVVPVSKKASLASEVIWKDDAGEVHHGQMGFKDKGPEGKHTEVREVSIKNEAHPTISGAKVRKLVPVIPQAHGEDILDKKKTVLVPTERLAQMKKVGFRPKYVESRYAIQARKSGPPVDVARAAGVLHETIEPMLARLQAIADVSDVGSRKKLLKKFLKDQPAMAAAMAADDSLSKAITPTMVDKFLQGLKAKGKK